MDQLSIIESSIKELWEKVKLAGETIARLRAEKASLVEEKARLEEEITRLRAEISARDQRLQSMAAIQARPVSAFTNGEREALTTKVKELLARLDAYL